MRWIAIFISLAVFAATADADSVTLKRSARLAEGSTVTLGLVAELSGDRAESLGDVVVIAAPNDLADRAWFDVTIDQVRKALDLEKINWGRVSLRGTACTVRRAGFVSPTIVSAPRRHAEKREPTNVDVTGAPTVRTRIVQMLARLYNVDLPDLRVLFEPGDEDFLNIPEAGRRIEVQPAATPSSSRFSVVVWLYQGDQLTGNRTMRLDLRVHQSVLVLTNDLRRGQRITNDLLRQETMWIKPIGPTPVTSMDQAVGSVARRRLSAGSVLRTANLESPVVIKRGEMVTVHCVSGGIVVKAKARAKADARDGEMVELSIEGSKKSFLARVVGPGRAVLNLDAHRALNTTASAAPVASASLGSSSAP